MVQFRLGFAAGARQNGGAMLAGRDAVRPMIDDPVNVAKLAAHIAVVEQAAHRAGETLHDPGPPVARRDRIGRQP